MEHVALARVEGDGRGGPRRGGGVRGRREKVWVSPTLLGSSPDHPTHIEEEEGREGTKLWARGSSGRVPMRSYPMGKQSFVE